MQGRNRIILTYVVATLALTAIALLFWATGFSERHSNLMKFVLFDPVDVGGDLLHQDRFLRWREFGALVFQKPETGDTFNYCPFAFFVILSFLSLPNPLLALQGFVGAAALIAGGALARAVAASHLALAAVGLAVCTSYPFLFLFDRGNIEGTLWIPSAAGVYFFLRKRYLAAAICFALAACIKPFPSMLFLLLLARRRFREFAIGAGISIAVALATLVIVGPDFGTALHEWARGFGLVSETSVFIYVTPGSDHSLFELVKLILRALYGWPRAEAMPGPIHMVYPYYMVFGTVIFFASVYRLWKMPVINQIFGVSVLAILISPVNFDYTLIAIYIPWAALLWAVSRPDCQIPVKTGSWVMALCAVLFTSQFYLLFGFSTSLNGTTKTLALAAILWIAAMYPMPSTLDESYATLQS